MVLNFETIIAISFDNKKSFAEDKERPAIRPNKENATEYREKLTRNLKNKANGLGLEKILIKVSQNLTQTNRNADLPSNYQMK